MHTVCEYEAVVCPLPFYTRTRNSSLLSVYFFGVIHYLKNTKSFEYSDVEVVALANRVS